MMQLLTCICVFATATSCVSVMSTKPSEKLYDSSDALTVFLTGNELGALQPCGCSGGQLGGFDRRSAVLNNVPTSKRLIVDTGSLVEGDREQDLIKFNIVTQAFHLLDYDLVNLAEKDIEIAKNLGLSDSISSALNFNVISAHSNADVNVPVKFTKQFSLEGKTVVVSVAAFDTKSASTEQLGKLFTSQSSPQNVNILILNRCDTVIITSIARMGTIDCLVCPAESDEPGVIGDPNNKPLVVSAGRYGKYVGRLQITASSVPNKLKFSFSAIPVTEKLRQESSLVELYKAYQLLVKEANLLERYPRFALPNGLEYAGSKSCELCHEYEYEKWSGKAHAHAYATLEKVGSQYDPECVLCHVVGAEYERGFISEQKTAHLKNVGCENCHGPGSAHITSLGKTKTTEPWSDCTDCHSPERSTNYADNKQLFFEKIIHWREPNSADNVKK